MEHIVARIPRPDGELRVLRKTYNGSKPFTSIHRYYVDEKSGELKPSRQNVTLRDESLGEVIAALTRIARRMAPLEKPSARAQRPRTPALAKSGAQLPPCSDEELAEIDAAF